jgi:hypothetical protein
VSETVLQVNAFDMELELNMHLNGHLIPENFRARVDGVQYQEGHENCFYHGSVNGHPNSAVSMTACNDDIVALVYLQDETLVIEPLSRHDGLAGPHSHVVYRAQDMKDIPARGCASTHGENTEAHSHHDHEILSLPLHPPARKLLAEVNYVELKMVSDVRETAILGSTAEATTRLLQIINNAQVLYDRLDGYNVILSVVATDAWTSEPSGITTVTTGTDITSYLYSFRDWSNNAGDEGQDNTHLMIGYDLSGGTAGVAFMSSMCGSYSSGVSEDSYTDGINGGYKSSGYDVWTTETVTHELGHNFGASHDSDNNDCPSSGYIMAAVGSINPSATTSNADWSSCSVSYIGNLIQALSGTASDCMANVPNFIVGDAVCGDGIVSEGEDCEPSVSPSICNADCTFTIAGAVCNSGACCDTSTGQLKVAGQPCREAVHQCDIVDRCDGTSAECGVNYFHADGTPCDEAGEGGFCSGGSCKGVDGQCAVKFALYESYGYWSASAYGCVDSDPCGDLLCSTASLQPTCYYLSDYLGNPFQIDEGTPCGTNSVCSSGVCTALPTAEVCPNDCNGQGDCSQSGVCVCYSGYSGEACTAALTTCPLDCAGINREGCVSEDLCGTCLAGYGSYTPEDYTSECELVQQVVDSVEADATLTDPTHIVDNDFYSHWVADFSTGEAVVSLTYATGFPLHYYEIMSANTLPSEDPQDWIVEGSNDGDSWTSIDSQSGIQFSNRHQVLGFLIEGLPASYTTYRFTFTEIRDAVATPSLQIAEVDLYEDLSPLNAVGFLAPSLAAVLVVASLF